MPDSFYQRGREKLSREGARGLSLRPEEQPPLGPPRALGPVRLHNQSPGQTPKTALEPKAINDSAAPLVWSEGDWVKRERSQAHHSEGQEADRRQSALQWAWPSCISSLPSQLSLLPGNLSVSGLGWSSYKHSPL